MKLLYDPPSGWRYGFPKVYAPLPGESLQDTLRRDGYPAKDCAFGARHCRMIEVGEEEAVLAAEAELGVRPKETK